MFVFFKGGKKISSSAPKTVCMYRGYGYVPLRFVGGTSLGEWKHTGGKKISSFAPKTVCM